jgi:hypothetical protein
MVLPACWRFVVTAVAAHSPQPFTTMPRLTTFLSIGTRDSIEQRRLLALLVANIVGRNLSKIGIHRSSRNKQRRRLL